MADDATAIRRPRRPTRTARLAKATRSDDDPPARIRVPWHLEKARRRAESKIEAKLKAAFEARLTAQRDAVIALLRRKGLKGDVGEAAKATKSAALVVLERLAKKDGEDAAPKIDLSDEEIIRAIARPLSDQIVAGLKAGLGDGGDMSAESLGIKWQESDPAVVEYLKEHRTNLEDVLDATTAEKVKNAIAAGYENGEGGAAILQRVYDSGAFSAGRAGNIARTEAHTAVASGNYLALDQAGGEHTWIAAPDARPTHQAASGQTVEVGEPFEVGEAELLYPGDPVGGADYPEEICGCRCVTVQTPVESTTPADLAESLDLDSDDDALAQRVTDAAESLPDDEVARIDPADVDALAVTSGDETGYDPETGTLTVGPKAKARDLRDAVREHLITSLLEPADARAFENQLALHDLPKPDVKGGEMKRAGAALRAIVSGDWEAVGEMFGVEVDADVKGKLKVLADNFWIGGGTKGPSAEKR